jgi:hypothetical protein
MKLTRFDWFCVFITIANLLIGVLGASWFNLMVGGTLAVVWGLDKAAGRI